MLTGWLSSVVLYNSSSIRSILFFVLLVSISNLPGLCIFKLPGCYLLQRKLYHRLRIYTNQNTSKSGQTGELIPHLRPISAFYPKTPCSNAFLHFLRYGKPPFLRIHITAVHHDSKVQMRSCGLPGAAHFSDKLSSYHRLSFRHIDPA